MACEEAELGPEAFARKMEEVKKSQQQVHTHKIIESAEKHAK